MLKFKIKNDLTNQYLSNTDGDIFLLISLMHINGFINDDSIKAQFKMLRNGKLLRRVNTYKSNVNDKWYNDESIYYIYQDVLESRINPKSAKDKLRLERINKLRVLSGRPLKVFKTELSFDEVMKYLNLYLNKNRNFCIDYLYSVFIKPLIETFRYNEKPLKIMFDYDFSNICISRYSYGSYCCDDCDGDYEDYLESKSEYLEKENIQIIKREISAFLNTKRSRYKDYVKE